MPQIFPPTIRSLPQADIPIEGVAAFLSQAAGHQILFMEFEHTVDLPEHAHAAQVGCVLRGRIDMTVGGRTKTYIAGDIYEIKAGVAHSATIHGGYADITFFNEPHRYQPHKAADTSTSTPPTFAESVALEIRSYEIADQSGVIDVWKACGLVVSHNDPVKDIQRKLEVNPEWFLVGCIAGRIAATCMAGYEGHRGWINYLAVLPQYQRRGFGQQIMAAAQERLKAAGCPKINLQVRATNGDVIAFYQSVGFSVESVVNLGKRLVADI